MVYKKKLYGQIEYSTERDPFLSKMLTARLKNTPLFHKCEWLHWKKPHYLRDVVSDLNIRSFLNVF